MRNGKVVLFVLTILITVLMGSMVTQAKGPADRITIRAESLDQDIVVTDNVLLSLLSWEHLMDLPEPLAEAPTDIGEGYEIMREYRDGNAYRPFDNMVYYPSLSGGHGYIYFEGIVNGSSEYDKEWFATKPAGEAALRRLLDYPSLMPYVVAVEESGRLQLLDATTLEPVSEVDMAETIVQKVGSTHDGQALLLSSDRGLFRLDVNDGALCLLGEGSLLGTSVDGQHIISRTADALEIRDAAAFELATSFPLNPSDTVFTSPDMLQLYILSIDGDAPTLTPIDTQTWSAGKTYRLPDLAELSSVSVTWDAVFGVFLLTDGVEWLQWSPYFERLEDAYDVTIPVSATPITAHWNQVYALPNEGQGGGIWVEDRDSQRNDAHWLEDMTFSQVIAGGDSLYALSGNELLRLDSLTGDILSRTELANGAANLAYTYLDNSLVGRSVAVKQGC